MLFIIPLLFSLLPFGNGANVTLTDGRVVSVSAVPLYYKGISLFNSLKYLLTNYQKDLKRQAWIFQLLCR